MKASKDFRADLTQTNIGVPGLVQMQLSYSTADIEKTIFHQPEFSPVTPQQPLGDVTILVVHGEMYALEGGPFPQPAVPLTEESGLFRIINPPEEG